MVQWLLSCVHNRSSTETKLANRVRNCLCAVVVADVDVVVVIVDVVVVVA